MNKNQLVGLLILIFVLGGIMLAVNIFAPRNTLHPTPLHPYSSTLNWDSIRTARRDSAKAYWDSVKVARRDSAKAYWDSVKVARRDSAKAYWDSVKATHDSVRIAKRDSFRQERTRKRDTILNLNTADTTTLQYIRGIGPYIAKQIIWYRRDLGGFVSTEQLRDIEVLCRYDRDTAHRFKFDTVLPHLMVDSVPPKRIMVNSASIGTLAKHPYINYEQAKALYELRRRKYQLQPKDLIQVFNEEQAQRLMPYLDWTQKKKR